MGYTFSLVKVKPMDKNATGDVTQICYIICTEIEGGKAFGAGNR